MSDAAVHAEASDRRKAHGRSRVSNGKVLLPGIDGRNTWVRRCKDVIAAHLSDLGGLDNTSAAERSIIRRVSTLTVELERLEAKFALAGEASADDLDLYQRTAGGLRRLLEAIGLERRAKNVGRFIDGVSATTVQAEEWSPMRVSLDRAAAIGRGDVIDAEEMPP
jgi:hypothetical protein